VKESIKDEITKLKINKSLAKVGLVTFSDRVILKGDGNADEIEFRGKILDNYNDLLE
jgi:hypothetical protein